MDKVLRSWFKVWTIITIVHKLQSIVDFDKVAVLDAGKLVEFGVPRELLQQDSIFRGMYESTSGRKQHDEHEKGHGDDGCDTRNLHHS